MQVRVQLSEAGCWWTYVSIEQLDVVDIISTARFSGEVTLTISDHLDWNDSHAHQLLLQAKLNRYLAFIESGEIFESYPSAKGKTILIEVVFQFHADPAGISFLERARSVIESAGFFLKWRYDPHPEATFN